MSIPWIALLSGLLLFLGAHSVRPLAEGWRSAMIARHGEAAWKGGYSLVAVLGLALVVWGYGGTRLDPWVLWASPLWARHLASLLTLVAFVLLAAAYVPGNAIKARLQHPMVLGVKVWALAHLLANNTLADLVLFGGFLVWAVLDFRDARRRPVSGRSPAAPSMLGTVLTVVIGAVAWAAFAFVGHEALIGVRPMG